MSVFRFIFAEPEFVKGYCKGCSMVKPAGSPACICPGKVMGGYFDTFKKSKPQLVVPRNFLCLPGFKASIDKASALIDQAVWKNPNIDPLGTVFGSRVKQELMRIQARQFGESLKKAFDLNAIQEEWFVYVWGYHKLSDAPYWGLYKPGMGTLWIDFHPNFKVAQYHFAPTEAQGFAALEERRKRYVRS